jgi:hypothetical protein
VRERVLSCFLSVVFVGKKDPHACGKDDGERGYVRVHVTHSRTPHTHITHTQENEREEGRPG